MKLSLGTAQFGFDYGIKNNSGKLNENEIRKIVNFAKSNDVNSIDTAKAYGDSEKVLGKLNLNNFEVVSKLPPLTKDVSDSYSWTKKNIRDSLNRLGIKKLHGYLIHNAKDLLTPEGKNIYKALKELKEDKSITKIGISCYENKELDLILKRFNIDIVQLPLNIIDRRFEKNGTLTRLKESNIEIHTRSCFLQGLLLMDLDFILEKFPDSIQIFTVWREWISKNNLTAVQAALFYIKSLNHIDRVVVGVDCKRQLEEITGIFRQNKSLNFPDISSTNENLINPSKWKI